MKTLKVACIQMRTSVDVESNIIHAVTLIRDAAKNKAKLIVTPEMTTLLDRRPGQLFEKAKAESEDVSLPIFRSLAKELSIELIIGSIPIRLSPDKCVNRSYAINKDGKIVAWYDKIHMFDVKLGEGGTYKESERFQAGSNGCIVNMGEYNVGLTICYDLRFPHLYRDIAKLGAQIITVPSSFTVPTGEAHWHVLLRARAIESGCFIIAPAQHGLHEDGRETYGHSLIIDPWGNILAEKPEETGIILADLNLDLVESVREKIPCLQHDRPYSINHY